MFTIKLQSFSVDENQKCSTITKVFEAESYEHIYCACDDYQYIYLEDGEVITIEPLERNEDGGVVFHDEKTTHVFIENSNGKTTDVFRQSGFDKLESGE